ncbi:uncharacterized protein EDB91DRAFT_1127956 [Suillus paluster]|uniref:uncharacterized protein n=1 Tax=Suillus paluster TaxID=48578 RepID=UPI001B86DA2F|nr:uncharacterized protein EDB91DRAFT_1127956 [Suillus paluster]KAG1742761.1 hypothetical protein EDB91DRAFT_1127956 [Suillus paluster]
MARRVISLSFFLTNHWESLQVTTTNSSSAYDQHIRDSNNHWICEDCHIDFDSWLGLKEHYVQSPHHHYCQYCNFHFNTALGLQNHYEDQHAYCRSCHKVFKNDFGLHEHNRQNPKHANMYCVSCKRLFQSPTYIALKIPICPFTGCGMAFINKSALMLHLESGSCQSGVNRRAVDNWVRANDHTNVITNPARLITAGERGNVQLLATEQTWNGRAYECVLCHTQFRALTDLNRHLASPRHQEKTHFASLSGLCQHIESERCGVTKFRAVQDAMNNLFNGVHRLTM